MKLVPYYKYDIRHHQQQQRAHKPLDQVAHVELDEDEMSLGHHDPQQRQARQPLDQMVDVELDEDEMSLVAAVEEAERLQAQMNGSRARLSAAPAACKDGAKFLEQYMASSRLHHLSAWKADFQEELCDELQAKYPHPPRSEQLVVERVLEGLHSCDALWW
jgi:hypothetical protein